ncbi:unnamed protein product [Paramecium pentaurelia]|uniref:Serine/threonine-protein phosphatase 4 regulatory subunit 3-like central domain-containing protein n=1 Tax=Paramecium pentaurelia TaxID=43138 RepID=A0A8S1X6J7_9CILI|nr:unnamed protein product [Paramecium pentaurelia]
MHQQQMNNQQRAKIYVLQGQWEEFCIGYVQIVHTDGATFIRCILETQKKQCCNLVQFGHLITNKEEQCLNLKVNPETIYEFQGDNIIQWQESEINLDIAISFIDSRYALEIWNQLQKRHFRYDDIESTYPILPSQQNLEAILSQISDSPELIIQKITNDPRNQFMEAIKRIFEDAEIQSNYHVLEQLHYVIRSLIYIKNESVMKSLLSEKYYMTLFGIMEYHSENKGPQRVSYRNFLKNQLRFHKITEFEEETIEKIHFNYRLSYLKESVMAYYLYIEDPLYNEFNFYIHENNSKILESLLIHHKDQFEKFLEKIMDDFEVKCKFINEFFLQFKPFLAIKQLNDAFLDIITQANLLKILYQNTLLKVQQQLSSQVCFTTLQITIMIANQNQQYLQDFLINNHDIFWQCMEGLLFCQVNNLNNIIIDIVEIICSNPTVQKQCIEWLRRCLLQPLNFSAALVLQELVQWICQQQKSITQDLVILSNYILNILIQQSKQQIKDKFLLMSGLKHFKYISTTTISEILKPYCNSLVLLAVSKRMDGILEGQIKDILKFIKLKNNLSQHLILIVKTLNCQNHHLFVRLLDQNDQIVDGKLIIDYSRDYEDSEEHQEQQVVLEKEDIKLDFSKIIRRRKEDEEEDDETHLRDQKLSGIIFGESCFKRIKPDDD